MFLDSFGVMIICDFFDVVCCYIIYILVKCGLGICVVEGKC